jgi:nitrite reductase/ring-hydroxylating ferredoxin subunit
MPDHESYPPFAESRLDHVGTYRRVLPVSLERMYENALDWEHLPYVHADSFTSIDCLDAGPWGWRARIATPAGASSCIELRLDRACRRWITRTLEGANAGSEIWTHAFPIESRRVDIVVDFFAPGVAREAREKVGQAFSGLYQRLYDEDVAMMTARQTALDSRIESHAGADAVRLGRRDQLQLPMTVEFRGRSFVVADVEGRLVAYAAACPHQLGPLVAAPVEGREVVCPWHGYRFDLISGECVSGQGCALPRAPEVVQDEGGIVTVRAQSPVN